MEPIHTEQNDIQLEGGEASAVETNTKKDVNYVLPSAILIAAVLISGSILYTKGASGSGRVASNTGAVAATTPSVENLKDIGKDEYVRGNRNADIIIVEFSDPECPYCKVFHQTMQKLMTEYGQNGKLAWVYRHFPLDTLHRKARAEAEAMECAGFVGGGDAFWRFADEVFARTNSNDSLDSAELPKIAGQIGIDQGAWNTCVTDRLTREKIEADTADAIASGAKGTPYSVLINTKTGEKTVIPGAQPYDVLKQSIETALAGK